MVLHDDDMIYIYTMVVMIFMMYVHLLYSDSYDDDDDDRREIERISIDNDYQSIMMV